MRTKLWMECVVSVRQSFRSDVFLKIHRHGKQRVVIKEFHRLSLLSDVIVLHSRLESPRERLC